MKKWIIIAILLLVVGGVGMAMTYTDAVTSKTEEIEQVFQDEIVEEVNVKTKNSVIYIRPSISEDIVVTFTGDTKANTLEANIKNNVLHVQVKSKWQFNLISIDFLPYENKIEIDLPERLYEKLNVHNKNGKIALQDMNSELIDLYTANGVIEVNQVTGNVKAKSANGIIRADGVEGEVNVSTSNGALRLANITDDIVGKTANGAIKYEAATIKQNIDLQSDNGTIKVMLTEKLDDVVLDLKTDVGTVRVNGGKDWQPKIGNGTYDVRLKTDVGSIKITDQ